MDVKKISCAMSIVGVAILTGVGVKSEIDLRKTKKELKVKKLCLALADLDRGLKDIQIKRLEKEIQELKENCKEKES